MKQSAISRAVLAALAPALIAGCSPDFSANAAVPVQAGQPAATKTQQPVITPVAAAVPSPVPVASVPSARALPDFSTLVTQVGPAVVNITSDRMVNTDMQMGPLDQDDPLSQFFRRFQTPNPQQAPARGVGSGFIVSPDGYVLTNAHVVTGASNVTVKLTDRREFQAKVVGTDPRSNVALLKIDATDLPAVTIGDPSNVKVGQWVVAVGSPFGFENSVTAGIVSAKSRSLPQDSYVPFIQTDVAINPGNSGGPLFDLDGRVIGINSQIYSRTGGYMGVSFAIPIDVAMKVRGDLQQFGKVTRGRLGVVIQQVNPDLAKSFGLSKPEGALVSSVEADGPAARAGIKPGNVIVGYNGEKIDQSADLPRLVGNTKPGQSAPVRIWRDGAERTLSVAVGEMPAQLAEAGAAATANAGKLGVQVRPLTQDEQRRMQSKEGLVVEQAGGAAAKAGVQPGDVILAINNEKVSSVEQLRKLLEKSGKHVALLVQREDARIYVPINLG